MNPGEDLLKSGDGWLVGDSWSSMWKTFNTSAFRLETLPEYRVASEKGLMDRFLAGQPMPGGYNSAWRERLRSYRNDGKSVQRVRVVTRPLTEYQRRQFAWAYPGSISAGEDIRILDTASMAEPAFPMRDFWMFDTHTVVLMHYHQDGTQIGRELLSNADAAEYARYREAALVRSVSFMDYQKSLEISN